MTYLTFPVVSFGVSGVEKQRLVETRKSDCRSSAYHNSFGGNVFKVNQQKMMVYITRSDWEMLALKAVLFYFVVQFQCLFEV